jgi:hypothetical protein
MLRNTSAGSVIAFLVPPLLFAAVASGAVPVFRNGTILLPIFVSASAEPEERIAAEDLARLLGKMSGCAFHVDVEGSPLVQGFYIGNTRAAMKRGIRLAASRDPLRLKEGEMGPDGFVVQSRDASVFVEGATPKATGFGVSWLLQWQGGVRWYAPGPLGEVVPRRNEWMLPEMKVVREPAYISREIGGLEGTEGQEWARHNGLRGSLEFGHALAQIFTPKVLSEHPEWAALVNSRPDVPMSPGDHNWQPNLALPEVADYAARVARDALRQDSARTSFSLGMSDTVRFDQSKATRAIVEPVRYFRGMPDYSSLVFTFMNRAAEDMKGLGGDGYLGCLAYFWCENTPPFSLDPSVIPYVTTDRAQYYDRKYEQDDLALMSRWGASGARTFGLWEYGFGEGFLIPREPFTALADSVRAGAMRGSLGYFAEIGPQWGFDAFKVWMLAQLLWEPARTLDELESDFFPGYYGASAAPMRQFFDRCETQWMKQSGPPYWLKLYQQEDQALLFPQETCRELRALLNMAARAADGNSAAAARVELTSRAFAVTEAFVAFDTERRSLEALETAGAWTFGEGFPAVAERIRLLVDLRMRLESAFMRASEGNLPAMQGTELSHFIRNDPVPRLLWLADRADPLSSRRLLQAAGPAAANFEPWRAMAAVLASGRISTAPDMISNGSFRNAGKTQEPKFLYPRFGSLPQSWQLRSMPTEDGRVGLVDDPAVKGSHVLRIEGAWDTQLYQWVRASDSCTYLATAHIRGRSSPGNDSALFMTFLSADGRVEGYRGMQSIPKGVSRDWHTMVLAGRTPGNAAWVGTGIAASRQVPGDWLEISHVDLRELRGDEPR